ncbi:integrase catalytic domain-containing protein [Trichonephila clavipes]|nr:integrase catalytic domain-containing protein [Trichonephila clavipes]
MGTLYKEFMNEYELLGHMEEIKNETLDKINYCIPHHSVYKPEKTSTPLRVVFDASAKTTSGFSLNSILLNGGIIQQDLFSIVSGFRKHEYAFSADIKKMYRQILVDPNQRDLQRIMWKTSADAPVKTYKLATVTYGTVSAPFLATRTLKALADEEKAEFPDAAHVICNDSYMDDILSGESTLEGAKKLQTRLSQLLQRGGFELHKWVSNSPELLKDLSASSYVFDKEFQDAPVKTLGMLWDPKVDCLTYKVKISDKVNFSKRDVLSEIARLYDPLGLIGPIVTKAKIFIQELWKIKLDWSEQLPPDAMEEWMNFYQKLSKVNNLKIQGNRDYTGMWVRLGSTDLMAGKVMFLRSNQGGRLDSNESVADSFRSDLDIMPSGLTVHRVLIAPRDSILQYVETVIQCSTWPLHHWREIYCIEQLRLYSAEDCDVMLQWTIVLDLEFDEGRRDCLNYGNRDYTGMWVRLGSTDLMAGKVMFLRSNQGGRLDSNESVADSFRSDLVGFKSWSATILGAFYSFFVCQKKPPQSGSALATRGQSHPSLSPSFKAK